MSKPCYTCKEAFINDKRQFLLNQTIEDATIAAKKDGFLGFIYVYQRSNGVGFVAQKDKIPDTEPFRYIYID